MTTPDDLTSIRPYMIRAWHEWCSDNGLTPYITVAVNSTVQVPHEYVKNGEIVLNIGYEATTSLNMGNEYLEFKARFSGAVRPICVPIEQVTAIFARENGQGVIFGSNASEASNASTPPDTPPPAGRGAGKPSLVRVK